MLDVMPELDHERDRPPLTRGPGEAFPQRPNSNKHHDRVTVVEHLGAHEPRKEQTENAAGARPRPAKHVNLVSLRQMLSPVREDDERKSIERAFMPNRIQLVVKTIIGGANPRGVCGC